ncbi:very long chain fatty acid elongase 7-like [Ornithodoros turicata]|uniref:very long chain fatty acid elongase 7-like n=1 Tax=Ornithodoros turicata TaxID=34597 RepID=UPI0031399619
MANTSSFLFSVFPERDPRTKDWETLRNPIYMTVTLATYLYIVKRWGPEYMKNRKPYDLRKSVMAYNLFQVVANVYFFSKIFYHSFWAAGYSPICQALTFGTDYHATSLLHALYWYLVVRVADFLDTMFFILKKKFSHITVLHVTHHTLVAFSGWMFMQFGADGQTVLGVCLNSFVHIVMYSYYFLSALGPSVQKYLWWKRYLTTIQIAQFVYMIFHLSLPLYFDCGYPRSFLLIMFPQVILILALFVNFYVHSYVKRDGKGNISNACFAQAQLYTRGPADAKSKRG